MIKRQMAGQAKSKDVAAPPGRDRAASKPEPVVESDQADVGDGNEDPGAVLTVPEPESTAKKPKSPPRN